jgi:hypothetical protein
MKHNVNFFIRYSCGILLLFLLNACTQEEYISYPTENLNSAIEHDKAIIESMGFDTASLVDMGDFYLVEGDIMFDKEELASLVLTKQARVNSLISSAKQSSITVGIDASIPTSGKDNWRTEIQQAIAVWNSVNRCTIQMTYTTASNPSILIRSDFGDFDNSTIAAASWPSNGNPGSLIRINLDSQDNYAYSSNEKKYAMIHELGHCLGLKHTDWLSNNEPSATTIEGTPTVDSSSIMNSHLPNNPSAELSYYDKVAIVMLYHNPFTGYLLNFPITLFENDLNKALTITAISNQSNLTYLWGTSGALVNSSSGQGTPYYTVSPGSLITFSAYVTLTNPYGEKLYIFQSIDGTSFSKYSYLP